MAENADHNNHTDHTGPAEYARPPAGARLPVRRRAGTWLAWWVLMMALWVIVDDSVEFDELLAGAGAAALAALGAELATYQASVRLLIRPTGDLARAILGLPAQLARDMLLVFAVLARRETSAGEYAEIPADLPRGEAGRVLLTGIRSFTPNSFVVDADADRGVLLVHRLAAPGGQS